MLKQGRGRRALAAGMTIGTLALASANASAQGPHTADGDDGDWTGAPTYITGTSVLDRGEFIHSDYVHDDYGANVDGIRSGNLDFGPQQAFTGVYPDPQRPTDPKVGASGNNGRFRWSGDFGYPSPLDRDPGTAIAGLAGDAEHQLFSFDDVADLVELRVAFDGAKLSYLVRLGALTAADDAVVGIGIDADGDLTTGASRWPRGANLLERNGYEYFITLWGTGGEITDYTGAEPATTPVTVAANTADNFIEAEVPLPAGATPGVWRHWVGTGLWDADAGEWQAVRPTTTRQVTPGDLGRAPRIFDLGFQRPEPASWWFDTEQADDLAAHDIKLDSAAIDLRRLEAGESGDRPRPTGVLNLQYRTVPLGPGEGVEPNVGIGQVNNVFLGPVQPYGLVLPASTWTEPRERPFMFFYHCLNCNQNIFALGVEDAATPGRNKIRDGALGSSHVQRIVDEEDMIVAGALQRGSGGAGRYGAAVEERDVRDILAAMQERDGVRIDPDRVVYAGMSRGGGQTKRLMTLYPDEVAAGVAYSSTGLPARAENIRNIPYVDITGDTGLDASASTSGRSGAAALTEMGYRHLYVEFIGRAHDFNLVYETLPIAQAEAWSQVRDENPGRVTYRLDRSTEHPELGLIHDSAYWTSGLELSDGADSGRIDATAMPLAHKLPKTASSLKGHFVNTRTANQAFVDWVAWDRDLTGAGLADYMEGWQPLPDVTVAPVPVPTPELAGENAFEAALEGLGGATLDLDRMAVDATEPIDAGVESDGPVTLTLQSAGLAGDYTVTVDGAAQTVEAAGGRLELALGVGAHTIEIAEAP